MSQDLVPGQETSTAATQYSRAGSKSQDFFVGREREKELYKKFLAKEIPWVLIITGLGGIGKTTLLHVLKDFTPRESMLSDTSVVMVDFAQEKYRKYPLTVIEKLANDTLLDCNTQLINQELRHNLQHNFDQLTQLADKRAKTSINESEDRALQEIYHQMRELATQELYLQLDTFKLRRLVIMLDTCEWLNEPEGIEVGQWVLNELIPGIHTHMQQQGRQCSVLFASRVQPKLDVIAGQEQRRLTLPMLDKQAVDQYLAHVGMQDSSLRQYIFEITHGHALSISLIGMIWENQGDKTLSAADLPAPLQEEFNEHALVASMHERVLASLKPPFKELTKYGVLLRNFDLPFLQAVFPELLPETEALDHFNQLTRYPYIESQGNYRYAFHELVRHVLAEEVRDKEPEKWQFYHQRALKYLTNLAPYSPDWYYHNLASNEKQGIRDWQQAIQEARGRREQISALLQAALDKTLKFEPAARAEIDYEHGRFQYYGAKWEEALASYREALTSFQQVDDHPGQAKVLQAIGDIQRILGEQENALESYEQALAAFKQVDDRPGQAKVLQAIGDVQRLRNEQGTALQNYEQALNLFQRLQDQPQEAKVLEAMGDVQRLRDQLDAALRSYQQALALYQEEQDRPKRAKVLKAIGDIQRLRQDERAALESYGQALAIFGDLKEPVEEANVRQAMHEMQHINNDRTTVPGSFEQSYPKTLESVLTTRNRSWLAWIAVPIAFVLTLGLLLVGLPQVFPEQPPAPTLAQHAQGVVEQFYQHINARDYADAYKLLKTNSAQDGYCSLVNGYMLTEHDGVTYNGVTTLPDGTFKVAVTIVATELFATGTVKTTYDGYEVVDPGMWQIKSGGRLDRIGRVPVPTPPPSPDPLQAAQAVVQQYHSDINARNYPHAFSLWGADFHSITDYCTFVEGFSRTRSDDVHIDDTTLLSNGIVQVVATVNATEDTGSGTTMKVYHETYIVWQEHNGAWRILRGTLI